MSGKGGFTGTQDGSPVTEKAFHPQATGLGLLPQHRGGGSSFPDLTVKAGRSRPSNHAT
jgi:hypothetical protein